MARKKILIRFIAFILFFIASYESFVSIESKSYNYRQISFSPEDSAKSLFYLRKQIQSILKKCEETKTKFGIAIYSIDRNDYIFKHNIESYFIPASLTKLFTTVAALKKFGPDFQVRTSVYYTGKIISNTLFGDLFIYGRGDALLSISDLDYLAEEIKKIGIKQINGNIIADASFFDHQSSRFQYSGDADLVQELQPITSLSIEENVMTIIVSAGSIYGRFVNVQVTPNSEAIKVNVSARVVRDVGDNRVSYSLQPKSLGDQTKGLFISQHRVNKSHRLSKKAIGLNVTVSLDENGFTNVKISGTMHAKKSQTYSFFIEKPAIVVAGALANRLKSFGVQIDGKIAEGRLQNENVKLIAEINRPLLQILSLMNKNSDNYLAETVFKMIGAYDRKMTSDSKEAVHYILSTLDSFAIPCLDCKIYDGSGLSRRNRFSPESIVLLLLNSKNDPKTAIIDSLLSIAGYDGTLKNRMNGTQSQGRVFAKTGTHSNSSGLAGYLKTLDNERIIFAFMFNGDFVGTYKKIEDNLCQLLTSFFYANKME